MAKRKKSRKKTKQKTAILPLAGLAVGGYTLVDEVRRSAHPPQAAMLYLTGMYGGKFHWKEPASVYGPIIGGAIASKIMSKVGINKILKLPYFKL